MEGKGRCVADAAVVDVAEENEGERLLERCARSGEHRSDVGTAQRAFAAGGRSFAR